MSNNAISLALLGVKPDEIVGLDPAAYNEVGELFFQWANKQPRNAERRMYLDMKNKLSDLGAVLPKQLVDRIGVVSGWATKAVNEVANRINLDEIVWGSSDDIDPFGLHSMLQANSFDVEFPQAVASELAHSCVFATVTPGDRSVGEPDSLLQFHSAMWATGLYDRNSRQLRAGLVVNELDKRGLPVRATIFRRFETVVIEKLASGKWAVVWAGPNTVADLGRIPMEFMAFHPDLDRPFGRSRIDRAVMSLIDRAIRAGTRLEVHSELYSTMKLILLGVDENEMKDNSGNKIPLWSFMMDRVNTVGRDENGDLPQLQTINSSSPEPHISTMRQLAVEFSGHTGVSLSSLGVFTDNAESADAKREARDDVVSDAERHQKHLGHSLGRLFEDMIFVRDGEIPAGFETMELIWRRPDRPSLASQADAAMKMLTMFPELAGTAVGYEIAGMRPDQIRRLKLEKQRGNAKSVLDQLLADAPDEEAGE